MAHQTSKNSTKQSIPRSIGRLMDADLSLGSYSFSLHQQVVGAKLGLRICTSLLYRESEGAGWVAQQSVYTRAFSGCNIPREGTLMSEFAASQTPHHHDQLGHGIS